MSKINDTTETIAAIATPSGRGGIGIIRVSGSLVKHIITAIVTTHIPPRQAIYAPFYDEQNQPIDHGIVLYFPHPHSFTGEDIVEFQGHGGPVVMDRLLQRIIQLGARLARPGEFSERAFLNGKMDLAQAEAIADLIDAASTQAARLALRSLQGDFSTAIQTLTQEVIHLRMYVEAAIDFVDEEINFLAEDNISQKINALLGHLEKIQSQAQQGSLLREGIRVVIVGQPNVGKSSLLNRLSGKELAIVTPIPGTTRDVLRDQILIDDMPIHIIDTAGLRNSEDIVEQEGIRRARLAMQEADILLYLVDASIQNNDLLSSEGLVDLPKTCPVIFIRNKIDLLNEAPSIAKQKHYTVISLSVKNNIGIDFLKAHIKALVGFQGAHEGLFLARRRHLVALADAHRHIELGRECWRDSHAVELLAEELRQAQSALGQITGEFSSEDLLGKIFASFCIGK